MSSGSPRTPDFQPASRPGSKTFIPGFNRGRNTHNLLLGHRVQVSTGSHTLSCSPCTTHSVGAVAPGTCGGGAKTEMEKFANNQQRPSSPNRSRLLLSRSTLRPPYRHIARSRFAVFLLYIACHNHQTDLCPGNPPTALISLQSDDRTYGPQLRLLIVVRYRYVGSSSQHISSSWCITHRVTRSTSRTPTGRPRTLPD